jgi:hypothetical protein
MVEQPWFGTRTVLVCGAWSIRPEVKVEQTSESGAAVVSGDGAVAAKINSFLVEFAQFCDSSTRSRTDRGLFSSRRRRTGFGQVKRAPKST